MDHKTEEKIKNVIIFISLILIVVGIIGAEVAIVVLAKGFGTTYFYLALFGCFILDGALLGNLGDL